MTPAEELRTAVLALTDGGEPPTRDLAEPLVELLSHLADDMDDDKAAERQNPRIDGGTWTAVHPTALSNDIGPRFDWTAALAVARAINGGK